MTLHATRAGKNITVHGNTGADVHIEKGVIHHVRVTEHWQHVRGFRDQLNVLLDEAEAEEKADHDAETKAE